MAKKQNKSEETLEKTVKKPGVGAAFGSVILFIFTMIMAALLLCSSTLYLSLQQNSAEKAVSRIDLSQIELTDDGRTQNLGDWVYTWYMEGAPNLTPEYAQAALTRPEIKNVLCDYLENLRTYLLRETNDLPQLDAAAFADVLQNDLAADLEQETGVRFTNEDRAYFLWATDEDFPDWNEEMHEIIGFGAGKTIIRLFCSLAGVITAGVLTIVLFVLWLIFAIKGHWRKGRMLIGYGVAVAVPSLLLLLSSGILLLLVNVIDVISALSFAADGLPTVLMPAIWPSLAYVLCGVVITLIGIFANAVGKSKRAKKEQAAAEAAPVELEAPSQPASVPQEPETSPFVYSEMHPETISESKTDPGICPHCGAKNDSGSKFCGSCGGTLS